jgi:glycosyltransferase involved in cell wall biosynthesis
MKSVFLESHNIKNRASGLGTFNYELIKGLSQLDLSNFKITLNSSVTKVLQDEFGSKFNYHEYNSLQRYSLFRINKKNDVWHSLNQNTKVEPFSNPKKYILTVHDVNFVEENSKEINNKSNKLFIEKLNRADCITYISNFAKEQTHKYFEVPKVPEYIIYNGNPIQDISNQDLIKPNFTSNRAFFFSIGDFIERKNFHSLVEMMRIMPNYDLIISGNNEKPYGFKIQKMIEKYQLKNVFLTGKITDNDKHFYLKNCTAFLFPSIREGFGLPPIEAMAYGKPVFISNKTSLPEIGGDAAFYWKNFDPEYMKSTLITNLELFNSEGNNAIENVKKRANFFDWKKAASEYLSLYK